MDIVEGRKEEGRRDAVSVDEAVVSRGQPWGKLEMELWLQRQVRQVVGELRCMSKCMMMHISDSDISLLHSEFEVCI